MVNNKGKGGKNRRKGKGENVRSKELALKEEGQEYGQVTKLEGNCRVKAYCFDGKDRSCHIRGALSHGRKVFINMGDVILIGLRDYQDDKADVLSKYTPDEVRQLKKMGEIPETVLVSEKMGAAPLPDQDDLVVFDSTIGAGKKKQDTSSDDDGPSPNEMPLPELDDL